MVVMAPFNFDLGIKFKVKVFLAGTIDNGSSEDWQDKVGKILDNQETLILNPRRKQYNSKLSPVISNPDFLEQVEWEKKGLDAADFIIFNFLPESISPITLLELGLYADTSKCLVCCPEKFWRSGNVKFICKKYNIPYRETIEEIITLYHEKIQVWR